MNRLALITLLLCGCGASALQTNARAAIVAGQTLSSTRDVMLAQLRTELDACQDLACVHGVAERYQPALAAFETARTALSLWVESIALARAADHEGGAQLADVLRLGREFISAYAELARAYQTAGIDVPSLPGELTSLAGVQNG